mgnify:FL=1
MPLLKTGTPVVHHFRPPPREDGWRHPRGGITVALQKQDDGSVAVGFALCKYEDVFVPYVGARLARQRMKAGTGFGALQVKAHTEAEALQKALLAAEQDWLLHKKLQENCATNGIAQESLSLEEDVDTEQFTPDGILRAIREAPDCEELHPGDTDEVRVRVYSSASLGKAVRMTMRYRPFLRDDVPVGLVLNEVSITEEELA